MGRAPRDPRLRRRRARGRRGRAQRPPPTHHTARAPQRARLRRDDADDPRARLRQVRRPARALRGRERRRRGPRHVGVLRRGHLRHARTSEAGDDAGDRQQRRRVVERAAAGVRRGLGHRADVHVRRLAAGVPGVRRARGVSGGAVAVGTREGEMGVGQRFGTRLGGHDGAHIVRERWDAPEPGGCVYPVIVHRHDVGAQVLGPERRARARREGLRRRPDQPG